MTREDGESIPFSLSLETARTTKFRLGVLKFFSKLELQTPLSEITALEPSTSGLPPRMKPGGIQETGSGIDPEIQAAMVMIGAMGMEKFATAEGEAGTEAGAVAGKIPNRARTKSQIKIHRLIHQPIPRTARRQWQERH